MHTLISSILDTTPNTNVPSNGVYVGHDELGHKFSVLSDVEVRDIREVTLERVSLDDNNHPVADPEGPFMFYQLYKSDTLEVTWYTDAYDFFDLHACRGVRVLRELI